MATKQPPDKQIRVKLVLEGAVNDVMEVVTLAMVENLMKQYEVDEEHIPLVEAQDFFGDRKRSPRKEFAVGDRVRFKGASAQYGMHGGEIGTITKVIMLGRRSKVAVRWDDNTENEVGGSYIEIITVGK